jgi:DNA-binding NarL/FixJ family response regulator
MRIVIAEDSVLMREGLRSLLAGEGHDIVSHVGDADALRSAVRTLEPDLAIIDVRMPPTQTDEGARAAVELRAERPELAVLLLSQDVETHLALTLMKERPSGFGYLLKDRVLAIDDFLEAVDRVARGGSAIDPEVVLRLMDRRNGDDPLADLTARERELLALIAEGQSNAAIGARLFLSQKTVDTHVHNILHKLGLPATPDRNRRVLAVLAYLGACR